MPRARLALTHIFFRYETQTVPLFHDVTIPFSHGWTGIFGPNGAGKSTLLKIAAGIIRPDRGAVECTEPAFYFDQRTDTKGSTDEFLMTSDPAAIGIRRRLYIGDDWPGRWETLSHGERRRAQIGAILWKEPRILALDEPTNHIDADTRDMLAEELRSYHGIGILVSHDRDLLDMLCTRCVHVEKSGVTVFRGNYTESERMIAERRTALEREREHAVAEMNRIELEFARRRDRTAYNDRVNSGRDTDPRDHDARAKLNLVRMSGMDGRAAKLARNMHARLERSITYMESVRVKRKPVTGIRLDTETTRRDFIFHLSAGMLPLGHAKTLAYPDLVMRPGDRIALIGPNGGGKSTLVRHILASLRVDRDRVLYVPQEIPFDEARKTSLKVRNLSREERTRVMTVVSRLGSDPERVLETSEPSPGEARKLAVAIGMATHPQLILLDEPTNHMDLPSIVCLEDALSACTCGLFLVSHDRRFLARLASAFWRIRETGDGLMLDQSDGSFGGRS